MSPRSRSRAALYLVTGAAAAAVVVASCGRTTATSGAAGAIAGDAASKVYIAPGQLDEF